MKNWDWGLILICVVLAFAIFGGAKNTKLAPLQTGAAIPSPSERQLSSSEIEENIRATQYKLEQLQKETALLEEKKNSSVYKGKIYMSVNTSSDASTEYVDIYTDSSTKEPINITGWKLVSTSTNQSVTIPKSTLLYFAGQTNSEQDVYLGPNEHAYIITGRSPIGYGFKTNKCSGYLSQYTNFYPGVWTNCPAPRDEDQSSIPRRVINDSCFDLINSLGSCRIPEPLSNAYSSECQDFLIKKINYPYCISNHKNDKDFWGSSWYVYLKRSEPLWKYRRETVILYDATGKLVTQVIKY
ncbi:MAG: hypothetical protein NTV02_00215 [Candidatus Zambryskibacteria bacterium]|nr:hypothetical protein [Candidatus Zambryskibacteria bacterium]